MHIAIEVIGWMGAFLVLLAYWLVSHGRLRGTSFVFQAMNVGGAGLLCANAVWHGALPSAGVNVIWMLIGIWATFHHRRASTAG